MSTVIVGSASCGARRGGGSSLTGAALGGTTLPDAVTVHPEGRPGIAVPVWGVVGCSVVALGTQGHTLGRLTVEAESLCEGSKGAGAPDETSVTCGAEAAAEELPPEPDGLMVPPLERMLCQEPLVSL